MLKFLSIITEVAPKWFQSRKLARYDLVSDQVKKKQKVTKVIDRSQVKSQSARTILDAKQTRSRSFQYYAQINANETLFKIFQMGKKLPTLMRPNTVQSLHHFHQGMAKDIFEKTGLNMRLAVQTSQRQRVPLQFKEYQEEYISSHKELEFEEENSFQLQEDDSIEEIFAEHDLIGLVKMKPFYFDENNVKKLLKDLEKNQSDLQLSQVKKGFKKCDFELILKIISPKIEMANGILQDVQKLLTNEMNPNSGVLQEIIPILETLFQLLFFYLHYLHFKFSNISNNFENLKEGHDLFQLGLQAIKELYDPVNSSCGLWGLTKLTQQQYKQNLNKALQTLQQEKYDQSKKQLDFLKILDTQFKNFVEEISGLSTKVQQLQEEVERADQSMLQYCNQANSQNLKLSDQIQEIRMSVGTIMGGTKERETPLEKQLKGENQEFKSVSFNVQQIQQLEKDNLSLQETWKLQEQKLNDVIKKQELRNKKKMIEAAVECNLYQQIRESNQMLRQFQKPVNLRECLEDTTGVPQSPQWLESCISVIYLEKLNSDYEDDTEFRVRSNLNTYIQEFALCKLGCRRVAEVFLRDLSATVKLHASSHDRFLLFSELAGIVTDVEDLFSISTKNTKLHFNRKNNTTCIKMLLQALCALRKSKCPFMPNILEQQLIIEPSDCREVFKGVLLDEGIPQERSNYEENVKSVEHHDFQIQQKIRESQQSVLQIEYVEGQIGLSLDALLRFIVEELIRLRQREFISIGEAIKHAEVDIEGIISFEDFFEACRRSEPTIKRNKR